MSKISYQESFTNQTLNYLGYNITCSWIGIKIDLESLAVGSLKGKATVKITIGQPVFPDNFPDVFKANFLYTVRIGRFNPSTGAHDDVSVDLGFNFNQPIPEFEATAVSENIPISIYSASYSYYNSTGDKQWRLLGQGKLYIPDTLNNVSNIRISSGTYASYNDYFLVRYSTPLTLSWNSVTNANYYLIYTKGEAAGSWGYNWDKVTAPCYNTTSPNLGDWAQSAIGNYYRYYIQPVASIQEEHSSPAKENCSYIRIRVGGYYKIIDTDGTEKANITALSFNPNGSYTPPQKPNKTFAGYYYGPNGTGGKINDTITFTASTPNVTAYLYYTDNGYTISYNANGGSGVPANHTTYIRNNKFYYKVSNAATPSKSGASFIGWYTAAQGGEKREIGAEYETNSNVILYAHYSSDKTITYYKRNGENGTPPAAQTVKYDASITLSDGAWLTKTGYDLQHWQAGEETGPTYALGATYSESNSLNLYSSWTPKNITITWGTAPKGPISASYPASTYPTSRPFGTTFTLPELPTLTGDELDQFSPKEWLVNGTTYSIGSSFEISRASAYTIQGVYKKNTSWRGCFGERGGLWIYVGKENT